jgi:hypothetical protein
MNKTASKLAVSAATANPGALLAFGVASIAAGTLTILGAWPAAWGYLLTVTAMLGAHPVLFGLGTTAVLAFVGAGLAWSEARR